MYSVVQLYKVSAQAVLPLLVTVWGFSELTVSDDAVSSVFRCRSLSLPLTASLLTEDGGQKSTQL